MKNKLVFILAMMILASCSPQRRLARLLERYPLPEKIDTLYLPGETIYKDTTIYTEIPGETVTVELYVDVPVSIPDTSILAETELAVAKAYLKDNTLGLELKQLNQIYQFKLDSAIRMHSDTIVIEKETTVKEYIKPNPFWKNGFYILAGLIVVVLFLFFLLRRK